MQTDLRCPYVIHFGSFRVFGKKIQPHRHISVRTKQVLFSVARRDYAETGDKKLRPKSN